MLVWYLVLAYQLALYMLTGWSTSTTRVEPGVTKVPLAGELISIRCAKHAVVKAASKAPTVNFMASDWRKLEFGISSLYKNIVLRASNDA